jgi:hypothetical protein
MAWLEGKIVREKRAVGEWAAAATLTRFRREEENFACVLLLLSKTISVLMADAED